jgi:hypothetical protein
MLAVLVLTLLLSRHIPTKVRSGTMALIWFAAYFVSAGQVQVFLMAAEVTGVSLPLIVLVDATAAVSVFAVLIVSCRCDLLGLRGAAWSARPWSTWLAALAVPFAAFLLGRALAPVASPPAASIIPSCTVFYFGVVALWEEFIFRGLVFRQMSVLGMSWKTILPVQALLFAAAHHIPGGVLFHAPSLATSAVLFALGLLWGIMRFRWQSLTPSWVSHGLVDVLARSMYSWHP